MYSYESPERPSIFTQPSVCGQVSACACTSITASWANKTLTKTVIITIANSFFTFPPLKENFGYNTLVVNVQMMSGMKPFLTKVIVRFRYLLHMLVWATILETCFIAHYLQELYYENAVISNISGGISRCLCFCALSTCFVFTHVNFLVEGILLLW